MSFVEYTESELTRIPKDEDGMQDLNDRRNCITPVLLGERFWRQGQPVYVELYSSQSGQIPA